MALILKIMAIAVMALLDTSATMKVWTGNSAAPARGPAQATRSLADFSGGLFSPSSPLRRLVEQSDNASRFSMSLFQARYDPYFAYSRESFRNLIQRAILYFCEYAPATESDFHVQNMIWEYCISGTPLVPRVKKTLISCYGKYRQHFGSEARPAPVMVPFIRNRTIRIYNQEPFVDLCLPLYRENHICIEREYLTLCLDEMVVFLHSRRCRRPSEEDRHFEILLTKASLVLDYHCFQYICDGYYRVIERKVKGIPVLVWNMKTPARLRSCEYLCTSEMLSNFSPQNKRGRITLTANVFFPCCFAMHGVTWLGDPIEMDLNVLWDYLPFWCRVGEISLTVLVGVIGVVGAVGNLVVVVVLLQWRRSSESNILRTSLAFADLFTNLFVILPGFFDHLLPIVSYSNFEDSYKRADFAQGKASVIRFRFQQLISITAGWRFFRGLVFSVCSLVSLFTIFLLSIERLIITSRTFRYQHYFTVLRIKVATYFIWTLAILDTLFFMFDGNDSFQVTWSTMMKLPLSISRHKHITPLAWITSFQVILLGLVCLSVVVISILSIRKFKVNQDKVAVIWKRQNMRVSGPLKQENLRILLNMCFLTFMFFLSIILRGLQLIFIQLNIIHANEIIVDYLSWWIFLASSSWNPWIYNMYCGDFRSEVAKVLSKLVPLWLKRRMVSPEARAKKEERQRAQMKMLRKLNLIGD